MKYLQRRRRWIRAQKFWAWLRAKREQEYLDAASESSSEESEESSSGSEGDVKVLIFEGNPDARWVSPHSEAGRAAAAKASLDDDASGSGSATPVEDPGQMSMSPVQDDDSEDDFAPAKPQANDDSSDDFAPAKPKNGHDDDSDDDFKAAPAPGQPGEPDHVRNTAVHPRSYGIFSRGLQRPTVEHEAFVVRCCLFHGKS